MASVGVGVGPGGVDGRVGDGGDGRGWGLVFLVFGVIYTIHSLFNVR